MSAAPVLNSARPDLTADLMARTGLDDALLTTVVHRFYDRVRADPVLGPVFAARITDWGPHLDRMVSFWSSVALMTGRYHGTPMEKHMRLPVEAEHFDRWLALFRETAVENCPPQGADWLIMRAEKIASSIHSNIIDFRTGHGLRGVAPRL